MLGGGTWVTQNKVLPGAYINIVSAGQAINALGERGVVAFPYALNKAPGEVIEIEVENFLRNSEEVLGIKATSLKAKPLREMFKHATRILVYDLGTSGTAEQAVAALEPYNFNILAAYTDVAADKATYIDAVKTWRDAVGKKCQVVVYNATTPDSEAVINVVSTVSDYEYQNFTGDGTTTAFVVTDKPASVTAVLVNGETKTASTHYSYAANTGIVTFQTAPSEGDVVEVRYNNAPAHSLVAWVAGAEAGCAINTSCTNQIYDGEHTIVLDKTQYQLEQCITGGQVAFHLVYGDVRMLEDINSLTTVTEEKGEDFKLNQTIRVIDQIANDIARMFNTKYLGKIPNNKSGRVSLWADIVAHHRRLEELQAIEDFIPEQVSVDRGETKNSVVVNDVVTVVGAMEKLFMLIVIN